VALGPHLGKTQGDLMPAVRFLGTLQVSLALAIGGGAGLVARWLAGDATAGRGRAPRGLGWLAWALVLPLAVVVIGGAQTLHGRVRGYRDFAVDAADYDAVI